MCPPATTHAQPESPTNDCTDEEEPSYGDANDSIT